MLPVVKPVSKFGVWGNEVNKAINSNALASSIDTLTNKTSNGTISKLKRIHSVNPNAFGIPTRYASGSFYAEHDTVFITETEIPLGYTASIQGTWMALQMVPSNQFQDVPGIEQYGPQYTRSLSTNYYPIWPMPEAEANRYWLFLGGESEPVSIGMFLLKSIQGDYLTTRTWDGTTTGSTDIYIAKDPRLRNSVTSEVLDSVSVSYSYTSTVTRVASWTIDSLYDEEIQHIVPHYKPDPDIVAGEVIYAVHTDHTGVTVGTVELTWLELSNGKAWARSYLQ